MNSSADHTTQDLVSKKLATTNECQIIDARYFIRRIGRADERPMDRKFWSRLALWQWRHDWRTAKEAEDWTRLDNLSRAYEMIISI